MPNPSQRPRFQFSLRWLLIAMTLVALACGLTGALGRPFTGFLAWTFYVVFPTPLITAAIYARDDLQAFAVGALVPWTTTIWRDGPPRTADWANLFGFVLFLLLFGGICGALAVATRRWLSHRN